MSHPRLSRAASPAVQARAAAGEPFNLQLSDLDLQLLDIVCGLRVVTQTQLERLNPDVPGRTVRYRARRLHQLGLLGRTRPYRDSGSAPHHHWPTNRADALIRGERPARRGERRPPNPLFLAHGAALSELFVVLTEASDIELVAFEREGAARVDFRDAEGRRRAIVPDARVAIGTAALKCNVELDLGTMTHARLRKKLSGFLAHAQWRADEGDASPPPALLFITTSAQRARGFLHAASCLRSTAGPHARDLTIAACPGAERLREAVTQRCWRLVGAPPALTLSEVLRATPTDAPLLLEVGAPS